MGISYIEKNIIKRIQDAEKNGKNVPVFLIRFLGVDAIKEIIDDSNFYRYYKNINDNTAFFMIQHLIDDSVDFNFKYDKKKYIKSLLFNCKLDTVKRIIDANPKEVVLLFNNNELFYNDFWEKVDADFIKKVLDICVQEEIIYFYNSKILSKISILDDKDKIKYLSKINIDNDIREEILSSFTDRKYMIEAIRGMLTLTNWVDSYLFVKYLEEEEIEEVADTFNIEKSYGVPSEFYDFSNQKKYELIKNWSSNGGNHSIIGNFLYFWMYNMVDRRDYSIFNIIADIIQKCNLSSSDLRFDAAVASFLDEFSTEELLQFYINCNLDVVKNYIFKKVDFWIKEPFFGYLLNNEPKLIYGFLCNKNNFDELKDEQKSIFFKKENIKCLLLNKDIDVFSIIAFYSDIVNPLFLDKSFCLEFLKERPDLLYSVLKVNLDIEIFKFAIENGYMPDKEVYDLCVDKPEFYNLWLDTLRKIDSKSDEFVNIFSKLISLDNNVLNVLLKKAAESLDIKYEVFLAKFNALKSVNREILSTFDYRLFDDKFSFLSMNKIEMLAAHEDITNKLCRLTNPELNIVKNVMSYSSDSTWVDLIDRILINIGEYNELVLDLYGKEITIEILNKIVMIFSQTNDLKIKTYNDLCNYDFIVNKKVNELVNKNTLDGYKEAISLTLLGINYKEFKRIYNVYCYDFENFRKISKNQDLIKLLTLIKNVSECTSLEVLKDIYDNTARVIYNPTFLVNLDSEIRKEFTKLYNDTLYHVSEKDVFTSCTFKKVINDNDDVSFIASDDGISVSFYDPSGLFDGNNELNRFSLMMTSLGAYSDHAEPDDYYANWNVDLIASHGFCCSYLTEDNLGTARICHACLGFTDFDMGTLLLSAPYDIGSSSANKKFNTSRKIDTKFCTPRGMVDNTRHTHNEVVWERRNFSNNSSFKKEPSYVIFFCENFGSLSDNEKKIYNSSIKAAIQLGKGKPLPVVVIDRSKIAEKNRDKIEGILNDILNNYTVGDIEKVLRFFFNNRVGSSYSLKIVEKYFSDSFQESIIDLIQMKILDLYSQGNYTLASTMYNDYSNAVNNEFSKMFKDSSLFIILDKKFNAFKSKMDILLNLTNTNNPLYSNLVIALINMISVDCSKRWQKSCVKVTDENYDKAKFIEDFLNSPNRIIFSDKLDELVKQNIYTPNTAYDNRHIANMFLYTILIMKNDSPNVVELVLDTIKYQTCSYMDGKDKMNLESSLIKAEKLMIDAGYDKKKIDQVKLLMILKDKKVLSYDMIAEIREKYDLDVDLTYAFYERLIEIIHDVGCLEHTRFITAGELSSSHFYNKDNFRFARVAYELQESYAIGDINNYLADNILKASVIKEEMLMKTPQEVIRNIRKNRIGESKHVNNSFEDAFLEIDVDEKMDPLNLVSRKMNNFGVVPQQISILDFFKFVSESEYYQYLINKISSKKNLYLNLSTIHGETHANNVSLFVLYLATKLDLDDRDTKTLIEAAIYHDIGRISDSRSDNHGTLGALKYGSNVNCPSDISSDEVKFLIEAHALKDLSNIEILFNRYKIRVDEWGRLMKMVNIIRDADALDRTRFRLLEPTNNLDINRLVYIESKEIVESCQRLNYIIYQDYIAEQQKKQQKNF